MKFCTSCGKELADEAMFCPNCGTAVGAGTSASEQQSAEVGTTDSAEQQAGATENASSDQGTSLQDVPVPPPASSQVQLELPVEDSPSTKKAKKTLIGIAAGLIAILVIVLVCTLAFGKSYKDPIDDYLAAINKQTLDGAAIYDAVMPDFLVDAYNGILKYYKAYDELTGTNNYENLLDSLEKNLQDAYDDLEDDFGKNVKISYKVVEKEELSSRELKDYTSSITSIASSLDNDDIDRVIDKVESNLTSKYNLKKKEAREVTDILEKLLKNMVKSMNKVEITEGYEVTIKYTIKGNSDDDDDTVNLIVLKINGKWCLMNPEKIDETEDIYDAVNNVYYRLLNLIY